MHSGFSNNLFPVHIFTCTTRFSPVFIGHHDIILWRIKRKEPKIWNIQRCVCLILYTLPPYCSVETQLQMNITATPLSDSSLDVRWTAPADQATGGFVVEWFPVRDKPSSALHWERLNSSCRALVITGNPTATSSSLCLIVKWLCGHWRVLFSLCCFRGSGAEGALRCFCQSSAWWKSGGAEPDGHLYTPRKYVISIIHVLYHSKL